MKDWKPPLPVDKWYAHIWRRLLRKNSRKRAGMSRDTQVKIVDEIGCPICVERSSCTHQEELEEEFHWRYAILEKQHGGETHYHVCEEYPGLGYTDAETPMGETPEELQRVLEMMLDDVKGAIAHKNIIENGAPYDDWRAREIDKQKCVSAEETDKWLEELAAAEDDEDDIDDLDARLPVAVAERKVIDAAKAYVQQREERPLDPEHVRQALYFDLVETVEELEKGKDDG